MIYIFGDSHAHTNFIGFPRAYADCSESSLTMYRIGRDRLFPNYNPSYNNNENIFIIDFGEVDCRCHIGKQILLGRTRNEICTSLVKNYFEAIKENFRGYKKIIVCFIVPTSNQHIYDNIENVAYPFVGSDSERVCITEYMNSLIETACKEYGYIFLNCTDKYKNEDGTLNADMSDGNVHIKKNEFILEEALKYV